MGLVMFFLGMALFVGLMTFFFDDRLKERRNPNASLSTDAGTVVTLDRNAYGHYVATGAINGQPVVFLLDTGATRVSVPATVAAQLGLKRGASGLSKTANGTTTTYSTRLETVSLGGITLRDVAGGINPGMEGDEILLGMSFLKHLDLIQRGDTLTLRSR